MKKYLLLLALLFSGASQAVVGGDTWNAGFVPNAVDGTGSTRVWSGPGWNYTSAAAGRGATVSAAVGGLNIVEAAPVAMGDGRSLSLTATRYAVNAGIFAAMARLVGGPYGVVAALGLSAFSDWIAGDGEVHIRKAPDGQSLQKQGVSDSSTFTGQVPAYGCPTTTYLAALSCQIAHQNSTVESNLQNCVRTGTGTSYAGHCWYIPNGGGWLSGAPLPVTVAYGWLPASMDDIAPYMTPRVPSPMMLSQIVGAGETVPVTPVSVTNGPVPVLVPFVQTTNYPAVPTSPSTSTVAGNPYGLAPNTPTITSTTQGTARVNPGSSTASGPVPAAGVPSPAPLTVPTVTNVTSTYNATTNITNNSSSTVSDPQTVTTTVTNTTNVSNTSNSSTVNNTSNSVTNITNNTTNFTTTYMTSSGPSAPPGPGPGPGSPSEPAPDPCVTDPSRIGCAALGTPPAPDILKKTTEAVTITPSIFAGGGGCPSPISFSAMGQTYSFAYTSLCERMAALSALFLTIAAMVSAWIFINALKV